MLSPFRVAVLGFALLAAAAPAAADVDVVASTPVETISSEVFERLSTRGIDQLLLNLPTVVQGAPVDRVAISGSKALRYVDGAQQLTHGWSLEDEKDSIEILRGPGQGASRLTAAFDLPKGDLGGVIQIVLSGGGRELGREKLPILKLNRAQLVSDPLLTVRLPQALSPGDFVDFVPLDPLFTPGGGDWTIGGRDALWNGSFDKPSYRFEVPHDFASGGPLRVGYRDPWGVTLVDGIAGDVTFRLPISPYPAHPALTGCSPGVLDVNAFCVCGHFPTPESLSQVTLNGGPIGPYIVSTSPTVLNLRLPPSFPAGPLEFDAAPSSGFEVRDNVTGVLMRVNGEIDRDRLKRGESTSLRLWIEGTDRPVSMRLWNTTPGIVSLAGGNDQTVTTSGGATNQVQRTVGAVSVGDFALHYQLALGSCPCAEHPAGQIVDGGAQAPEPTPKLEPGGQVKFEPKFELSLGVSYLPTWAGKTTTLARNPCQVKLGDCDELLREAEAAEATARALRATAERARANQAWHDRQAAAIDETIADDRAFVETLKRQAAQYRELEQAAAESLAENERRAREQPNGGWEKSVEFDRAEVARRRAEAERLENEAREVEEQMAEKDELAENLREVAEDAESAAEVADIFAQGAREAYQACLERLAPECPQDVEGTTTSITETVVDDAPAGGSATSTSGTGTPPGGNSTSRNDKTVDVCGPDVTQAFTAALARVFRRMKQEVPEVEKGAVAGVLFLKSNGWNIDQWPVNPIPGTCPLGACSVAGNERGQDCFLLFGHCVPRHVLNDTMFGFTAALLDVPQTIQDLGGNWAEGSFNLPADERAGYTPDASGYLKAFWDAPDPEASRSCYRAGNGIAEAWREGDWQTGKELGEKLGEGWTGLLANLLKLYPSLVRCTNCPSPAQVTDWERDWSRTEWRLSGGANAAESIARDKAKELAKEARKRLP